MLLALPKAVYKTNKDLPFQGLSFEPIPQTPTPYPNAGLSPEAIRKSHSSRSWAEHLPQKPKELT